MRTPTLVRCALALASAPLLASAQPVQFTMSPDTITFTSQADQPVAAPQNPGIYVATALPVGM